MQIQINFGDVDSSPSLEKAVHDQVEKHLHYVQDHVTRMEVHLKDENAGKSGAHDKHVTMEARIANAAPIAVSATGEDMYAVIADTAGKIGRAVKTKLDKDHSRG